MLGTRLALLASLLFLGLVSASQYNNSHLDVETLLKSNIALQQFKRPAENPNAHPEAHLSFEQLVKNRKYPFEQHSVITDDGYNLTLFRIQAKNQTTMQSKPVVFMQHGLLDSADTFIVNDEKLAIAHILANLGYDVWLGNSRGSKHSRGHIKYNADKDAAYWQFTWQHMSQYDLPAFYLYIITKTGRKINYIGHSQGTLMMFAQLAENNKFIEDNTLTFIALGPVVFLKNMRQQTLMMLAKSPFPEIIEFLNINEFLSPSFIMNDIYPFFCSFFPSICEDLLHVLGDEDPSLDNFDRIDVFLGHFPSGTSVLNMLHFRQMALMKDYKLVKYDYGKQGNIAHYGSTTPPEYNLHNIRKQCHLFVGTSDELADTADVKEFLPIVDSHATVQYYSLGHMTFMYGKNADYFNDVVAKLNKNDEFASQEYQA